MSKEIMYIEHFEISSKNFNVVIAQLENRRYSALNNALLHLFREAVRENARLLTSLNNLTLASLSIRNLFEIYLISKHIHSDKKALLSWYGQSHKDSKDVKDGFIALMLRKGLDVSELEEIQKFEDEALKSSTFESKGSFQVREMAEKYGYLEDYLFIYKLSSKLVHPSSIKIMNYEVLTENENYLNIVYQIGIYFSNQFDIFLQAVLKEAD